ncbi:MAG: hypothetical protein HRT66_12650 [Flavobacteriaceae bacterium]|nr:hypothetical protein [Flavobacteriaceae bacterium]
METNIEFNGGAFGSGAVSGDGVFSFSNFIDSDGNSSFGASLGGQSSIGIVPTRVSVGVNVNVFYGKNHDRHIRLKDFAGDELNAAITIPIITFGIPSGLSFNYIDAEAYWGFGVGLSTPDTGISTGVTNTTIFNQ